MPKRPRPRARPQAPRRKGRRRQPTPLPDSSAETGAAASRVVPFAPRASPAGEATAAPTRRQAQDYGYVMGELRRIAVIGAATLFLVVVLSFVLT